MEDTILQLWIHNAQHVMMEIRGAIYAIKMDYALNAKVVIT